MSSGAALVVVNVIILMIILGIETSCDDTGIAVIEADSGKCRILSNVVSSQIKVHSPYGGVVPNLAARAHLKNIKPCFEKALKKVRLHRYASKSLTKRYGQAKYPKIDLIAITIGPGLIPSLLVGVNFAKALAYAQKIPIIGINHIEGHIYANWIPSSSLRKGLKAALSKNDSINTPFYKSKKMKRAALEKVLCLVVSGGHTQLILMENHGKYKLLGETRDDAVGEAFDKTAKLLGLGYPGGPILSRRAKKGDIQAFNLPRPMINANNFDFSFSGLKTAVLYEVKKEKKKLSEKYINDMSASFQQAAIDVLISKTIKTAKKYGTKTIMLSGGVAANQELRSQMTLAIEKEIPEAKFYIPNPEFCGDNGAMIAVAAFYKTKSKIKKNWQNIQADSNLKLIERN